MRGWAATGLGVVLLGILLTSAPIIFVGGAILLFRILAEQWPRRVLDSLDYEHQIVPHKTVVGDEVELTVSLWNRTRLPIAWASSQDTLGADLKVAPRVGVEAPPPDADTLRIAGPLRPYERLTRRLRIVPMKRGVHEIGPVRLRVAELFGTHSPLRMMELEPATVIARPLMAPVVGSLPATSPLAQTRARRSLFTDPTLFAGVRPFQTGDPVKSIHWRATARQQSLQTKRFEPSLSRQAMLVFDVQTVAGPYWMLTYDDVLFEDLAVATLSVARSLVTQDTACGFAAAGFSGSTQRYVFLPPRGDRSQVGRIGDALARLGMESSAPLTRLLAWLPRRVARGTTLVVLSGRDPAPTAAVAARLEKSGFGVHFLLFGDAQEHLAEARTMGLSARPARVDRAGELPHAVVVAG